MGEKTVEPRETLSVIDGVALIIGVVVGAAIFKTPSLVSANTGDNLAFFLTGVLGGAISLIGARCYAELAGTYVVGNRSHNLDLPARQYCLYGHRSAGWNDGNTG